MLLTKIPKFTLYICIFILVALYFLLPHYVELTTVLESWLPFKGLILYKETPTYHFPIGRLVALPLYMLSNWNLELTPYIGLLIGILSLMSIYRIGKKYLSDLGTNVALLFFTVLFWYFANGILYFHEMLIGIFLAYATLLLFNIYDRNTTSPKDIMLFGILLSLAELSGQIATLTVLAFITLLAVSFWIKKDKYWKNLTLIFLIGLTIPWIPTILYFFLKGALYDFYFWNIPYYLIYKQSRGNFWDLPFIDIFVFYTPLIASIILFIFNYVKEGSKKLNTHEVLITILSLSTIPSIIFSIFHPHHFNYALPVLAIQFGFLLEHLTKAVTIKKIVFIFSLLFILFALTTNVLPFYRSRLSFPPNTSIRNDIHPGTSNSQVVSWLRENTNHKERIMVAGNSMIYLRSDRLPASRPSKGMPYSWEPFERVKIEITSTPPDYWIIDHEFTRRLNTDYPKAYMLDFINKELGECYKLEITFDSWEIWSRNCN